jgi:hypothetical protein
MKFSHRIAISLLCLLTLVVGAQSQDQHKVDLNNGAHINGGVGVDERLAMLSLRPQYNLRLTFAHAPTGELLTGVSVTIEPKTSAATKLDTLTDCGPMLYVRLVPATYRVTATYEGRSKSSLIRVTSRGTDKVLYWPIA